MAFEQMMVRLPDGREFGPATMVDLAKWQQEGRVPADALLVDVATGETRPAPSMPPPLLPPPPAMGATPAGSGQPTSMDHMIPVKNPKALIAYYLGVFSIACGAILGPAALILGILGLRDAKQLQVGRTHALVGIIAGSITTLLGFAALILLIIVATHR